MALPGSDFTYTGRTVIYSSAKSIDKSNVLTVLKDSLLIHENNAFKIEYLFNYYKGQQPILYREKEIRAEINNMIVENHAQEIVSFKLSYFLANPIQYVRRGDDETISKKIDSLNEYMVAENKAACDSELMESVYVCGQGYRMILPNPSYGDECPFNFDVLPAKSTFIVYSNDFMRKALMSVRLISMVDGKVLHSIYTPYNYIEVVDNEIIKYEPHSLGYIPVKEYFVNPSRLGAFEPVITLLDAINTTVSNRVDGIEQFIQAIMVFKNCDITTDDFINLKAQGAIKIKSETGNIADVDILSKELNQTQTQTLVDYMYCTVLTLCGIPITGGNTGSTSDTGAAVSLRQGWKITEDLAKLDEMYFKRAENDFLRLALRIIKDIPGISLKLSDIEIKFNRRNVENLLTKTQGLQNMLEAGIEPLSAITTCELFNDPADTYAKSKTYLEKWTFKPDKIVEVTPANNKPNPKEDL